MSDMEAEGAGQQRVRRRAAARGRTFEGVRGRLKPHDPFELIRWLALSQPDPRKALAELVQNSLDAGARSIRVTRLRERGVVCLKILDDGEGIIPELERTEALRYIATHIGHSRKRSLSPQERLQLMTQGQYGIGLLGFWSLGEMLEMRTVVPRQRPFRLILHRDSAEFEILPLRGRLPIDERWTEVVVTGLRREATNALIGRRAADYLAAELRGQLLSREVDLVVEDRMARGRAQKIIAVRPPRFLGEKLEGIGSLPIPGYAPARLEIYLASDTGTGEAPHGLAVYSAGTLVVQSFQELGGLGVDHAPWTDPRLTGFIDFPDLQIAPGSRRGIVPNEAAGAFANALATLEPTLVGLLETLDRRRTEEMDRTLIRDLQRAFRDFYRHRPRYAMLPVGEEKKKQGEAAANAAAKGTGSGESGDGETSPGPGEALVPETGQDEAPLASALRTPAPELFPPGPLDSVRLTPNPIRVECRGTRRARAAAVDAKGRPVDDPVSYVWELRSPVGALRPLSGDHGSPEPTDGTRTTNASEADAGLHDGSADRILLEASAEPAEGVLTVRARSAGREAVAEVSIEVVEDIGSPHASEGIPEPEFVHEPGAAWRSRMEGERWQVNSGHRDFRAIAERPVLKLRYLAMLFSKEVVLKSNQDPRFERPLEQLVEIAAYADRNLADRRGRRPGSKKASKRPPSP